jgi:membrane protease YdiL (CAAX protease family)
MSKLQMRIRSFCFHAEKDEPRWIRLWISLCLLLLVPLLLVWLGKPLSSFDQGKNLQVAMRAVPMAVILLYVIFIPVVETGFVAFIVKIAEMAKIGAVPASIGSATLFYVYHALGNRTWIGIAWGFFLFTITYMTLKKYSLTKALALVVSAHAIYNLIAYSLPVLQWL